MTVLDTETLSPAFEFKVGTNVYGPPAISRCKIRCYLPCWEDVREVALPGGEVLRKVYVPSFQVFACGVVLLSSVAKAASLCMTKT